MKGHIRPWQADPLSHQYSASRRHKDRVPSAFWDDNQDCSLSWRTPSCQQWLSCKHRHYPDRFSGSDTADTQEMYRTYAPSALRACVPAQEWHRHLPEPFLLKSSHTSLRNPLRRSPALRNPHRLNTTLPGTLLNTTLPDTFLLNTEVLPLTAEVKILFHPPVPQPKAMIKLPPSLRLSVLLLSGVQRDPASVDSRVSHVFFPKQQVPQYLSGSKHHFRLHMHHNTAFEKLLLWLHVRQKALREKLLLRLHVKQKALQAKLLLWPHVQQKKRLRIPLSAFPAHNYDQYTLPDPDTDFFPSGSLSHQILPERSAYPI